MTPNLPEKKNEKLVPKNRYKDLEKFSTIKNPFESTRVANVLNQDKRTSDYLKSSIISEQDISNFHKILQSKNQSDVLLGLEKRLCTKTPSKYDAIILSAKKHFSKPGNINDYLSLELVSSAINMMMPALELKLKKQLGEGGFTDLTSFEKETKSLENIIKRINSGTLALKKFAEQKIQLFKKYGYADEKAFKQSGVSVKNKLETINNLKKQMDGEQDQFKKNEITGRYISSCFACQSDPEIKNYSECAKNISEVYQKLHISKVTKDLQSISQSDLARLNNMQKVSQSLSVSGVIGSISKLSSLGKRVDPSRPDFIYSSIAPYFKAEKAKQAKTDMFWNAFKANSPTLYTFTSAFAGLRNGFVQATVGTGAKLGSFLGSTVLGRQKGQTIMAQHRGGAWVSGITAPLSSAMQQGLFDEKGEFHFNLDNIPNQVGSSVANMLVLIYGGNIAAGMVKGVALKVGLSEAAQATIGGISSEIGLVSSSMVQQVPRLYESALENGLVGGEALAYSLIMGTGQSLLELVSPNKLISGEFKAAVGAIAGEGAEKVTKQIYKQIAKEFFKEIGEENLQEFAQSLAEVIGNSATNQLVTGSKLKDSMSWRDIVSTAIMTTLTTGVASGPGVISQTLSKHQKDVVHALDQNPELKTDVIQRIDAAIAEKQSQGQVDVSGLERVRDQVTSTEEVTDVAEHMQNSTTLREKIFKSKTISWLQNKLQTSKEGYSQLPKEFRELFELGVDHVKGDAREKGFELGKERCEKNHHPDMLHYIEVAEAGYNSYDYVSNAQDLYSLDMKDPLFTQKLNEFYDGIKGSTEHLDEFAKNEQHRQEIERAKNNDHLKDSENSDHKEEEESDDDQDDDDDDPFDDWNGDFDDHYDHASEQSGTQIEGIDQEKTNAIAKNLIDMFSKLGINVQVVWSGINQKTGKQLGHGQIDMNSGQPIIYLNPANWIGVETLGHEFAHLYLEMIDLSVAGNHDISSLLEGYATEFAQIVSGNMTNISVEMQELYRQYEGKYSDPIQFAKEFLVNQIGKEYQNLINNTSNQPILIQVWNNLIAWLKGTFGVQDSVAAQLAKDLFEQQISRDTSKVQLENNTGEMDLFDGLFGPKEIETGLSGNKVEVKYQNKPIRLTVGGDLSLFIIPTSQIKGLSGKPGYVLIDPVLYAESGGKKGYELLQDGKSVSVGRDIGPSGFVFPKTVSRNHVSIARKGDSFVIEDLQSSNGTRVDQKNTSNSIGDRINQNIRLPEYGPENLDEFFEAISQASTFEELESILSRTNKLEGSSGYSYNSNQLVDLLRKVQHGVYTPDAMTRTAGLRNKVIQLLNHQKLQQNIKQLWPKGLDQGVAQGQVGNCYFVASLYAIKTSQSGAEILGKMIEPLGQGQRKVNLFDEQGKPRTTVIAQADLDAMGNKKMSDAQLGDYIIERAFARLVHSQRGGRRGMTMQLGPNNELLFEGGWMDKVMKALIGQNNLLVNKNYINDIGDQNGFKEMKNLIINAPKNSITTLATMTTGHLGGLTPDQIKSILPYLTQNEVQAFSNSLHSREDIHRFGVKDINGKVVDLYFLHAYVLGEVDANRGYAEVINPHNTNQKRYWLKIDDIARYFMSCTTTLVGQNNDASNY